MNLNLNYEPKKLVDTGEIGEGDEWLKWRTTGIGGSDVSALVGCSPWTTKRSLYYSKIGLDKSDAPNPYTLDFGHRVEPFVAEWFQRAFNKKYKKWLEKKLGVKIDTFNIYQDTWMYQHPLFPFMNANLDYRWRAKTPSGKIIEGIFECKTTSYHIAGEKWGNDKVPPYYELQCRHYMAVMNVPYTIIACAWGNNEVDYGVGFVARDLKIEEDIINLEKDFWDNNVKARKAPALNEEKGVQEMDAFKAYKISDKLAAKELNEISHTDAELELAADNYLALTEQKKALEKQLRDIDSAMLCERVKMLEKLSVCDEAAYLLKDVGVIIKNSIVNTTRVDSKKLKEDYPEAYEDCKYQSSSERFSVKALKSK